MEPRLPAETTGRLICVGPGSDVRSLLLPALIIAECSPLRNLTAIAFRCKGRKGPEFTPPPTGAERLWICQSELAQNARSRHSDTFFFCSVPRATIKSDCRRARKKALKHDLRKARRSHAAMAARAERKARTGWCTSSTSPTRTSFTPRSRTPARFKRTDEAHAGHCLEQFPTQLQSWQRYAEERGMCSIEACVID
jgi:hypothetical protein